MMKSILSDSTGALSSTRLAFVVWALGVLAAWGYRSVTGDGLAEVPDSVMMIMGVLMTGKVAQKISEGKK